MARRKHVLAATGFPALHPGPDPSVEDSVSQHGAVDLHGGRGGDEDDPTHQEGALRGSKRPRVSVPMSYPDASYGMAAAASSAAVAAAAPSTAAGASHVVVPRSAVSMRPARRPSRKGIQRDRRTIELSNAEFVDMFDEIKAELGVSGNHEVAKALLDAYVRFLDSSGVSGTSNSQQQQQPQQPPAPPQPVSQSLGCRDEVAVQRGDRTSASDDDLRAAAVAAGAGIAVPMRRTGDLQAGTAASSALTLAVVPRAVSDLTVDAPDSPGNDGHNVFAKIWLCCTLRQRVRRVKLCNVRQDADGADVKEAALVMFSFPSGTVVSDVYLVLPSDPHTQLDERKPLKSYLNDGEDLIVVYDGPASVSTS